jgi:hypothetical protein
MVGSRETEFVMSWTLGGEVRNTLLNPARFTSAFIPVDADFTQMESAIQER